MFAVPDYSDGIILAAFPKSYFQFDLGKRRIRQKLWTIFIILLILWLLGVVTSYTIGGFIHLLLVVALVVLLINLIGGRRPVV
jgi:hypothetical protein